MAKEGQSIALNNEQHKEFMLFLANTRHAKRDRLIHLLTYRAGMRIGSVAQLRISDLVDESAKPKTVIVLKRCITKGHKTTMAYISHPELQEAIVEYIATLKLPRARHPDILFLSQKGFPLTPNAASKIMLKHYTSAGFEGSSAHGGRASFATNCLKNGVDIVALSKLMSHTSINTTMRYVRHNQEELSEMVSKI